MFPGLDRAQLGACSSSRTASMPSSPNSFSRSRRASPTRTSGKKSRFPMITPRVIRCICDLQDLLAVEYTVLLGVGGGDQLAVGGVLLERGGGPCGEELMRLVDSHASDSGGGL